METNLSEEWKRQGSIHDRFGRWFLTTPFLKFWLGKGDPLPAFLRANVFAWPSKYWPGFAFLVKLESLTILKNVTCNLVPSHLRQKKFLFLEKCKEFWVIEFNQNLTIEVKLRKKKTKNLKKKQKKMLQCNFVILKLLKKLQKT